MKFRARLTLTSLEDRWTPDGTAAVTIINAPIAPYSDTATAPTSVAPASISAPTPASAPSTGLPLLP